jgi:hypothetical protein
MIVKMCNFAQTTSSSYSTRNKYESYLLAKEEHDYLCAAVGMSARSVSWGLASLAQLCVCHYEQVEAQSSKKNLLMPLIEMLSHDLPALQRLLQHLDSPVTTDDVTNALLILRGLTSKKLQSLLGPAVAQGWATLFPSLTKLIGRSLKDSSKSEGVVIASILLVIGVSHREPLSEEDCKLFADLLMSVLENCVQVVYLGRSLVNRICNAPTWLLRALSLPRLLARVQFSLYGQVVQRSLGEASA